MFRVELLEFPNVPQQRAIDGLVRVFGLDEHQAMQWVRSAPVKVRSSVSETEAKRYTRALLHIGGHVRVIDLDSGEQSEFHPDQYGAPPAGTCPKCGAERQPGDSCVACGVVFSTHEALEVVFDDALLDLPDLDPDPAKGRDAPRPEPCHAPAQNPESTAAPGTRVGLFGLQREAIYGILALAATLVLAVVATLSSDQEGGSGSGEEIAVGGLQIGDLGVTIEARRYLRTVENAVYSENLSVPALEALIDRLYEAGAVEVIFADVTSAGGVNLSAWLVVELPRDQSARTAILAELSASGAGPIRDQGQRYADLRLD